MKIEKTLKQKLKNAKIGARDEFGRKNTDYPVGHGFGISGLPESFVGESEFKKILSDAYTRVFLEMGEEYTSMYLQGRFRRTRSLFSERYRAAKKALDQMTSRGGN